VGHQFTEVISILTTRRRRAGTTGTRNEYARYCWEAASLANRPHILAALRPSLTAQMRLWWILSARTATATQWGRSLGVVSYLDTLEIVAFLSQNPELRLGPLPTLVSLYARAWSWLRHDYRDDRICSRSSGSARGTSPTSRAEREWQQTTGFFRKTTLRTRRSCR